MLWKTLKADESLASEFSKSLGVSKTLGRLLTHVGLVNVDRAEEFLSPRLAQLNCPFAITNLENAVQRIEQAIDGKEEIVVFGDYDVDGITSIVQIVSILRLFEMEPRFCVPHRLEEGYGLSREAIDRAFGSQIPHLFIALDCGTNAKEPIAYLRELGVDVIIVDHHQVKEAVPADCILVNPHVNDTKDVPWRDLCTAGLAFKLLHGLLKNRRQAEDPRVDSIHLKDYLDLVAMGTIADLVPLHGENRILSWFGLRHLRANGRVGVRALAEVSGIDGGQEIVSTDVSFKMAPRINASGRLADASLPIELLLNENECTCREIAGQLDQMNRERQVIERSVAKEAKEHVERDFKDKPGIVLYGEDWHPGIVGIVASRMSREFHKPCVILGAEGEQARGSGRSVCDVNLVEIFQRCADLLEHWGGHPMAAGVSLKSSDVSAFTERFVDSLRELYPQGLPEPSLEIAAWLRLEDLSEAFLEELDCLHPFGKGNDDPVFGLRGVSLEEEPQPFGEGNFRLKLPPPSGDGRGISGVAWRLGVPPTVGQKINLAVRLSWNYWRNCRYPQITLVNWKPDPS